MINHARTLLLNMPGAGRPLSTFYLEEFVDPQYVPITLPTYLLQVRNALLGLNPDAAFANFRLWEIFRTIDSTDYAHYVTDLDSRVTYRRRRSVVDVGQTVSFVPTSPGNSTKLSFVGQLGKSALSYRLQYDWQITVLSPTVLQITSLQLQKTDLQIVTITDGLTNPVPLIGQASLFVVVPCVGTLPPNGTSWLVTAFAEPVTDLNAMLEPLARLGDAALFQLFPNREPYTLFRQLWNSPIFVQDRLTGMTLSYVYHANEVRLNV